MNITRYVLFSLLILIQAPLCAMDDQNRGLTPEEVEERMNNQESQMPGRYEERIVMDPITKEYRRVLRYVVDDAALYDEVRRMTPAQQTFNYQAYLKVGCGVLLFGAAIKYLSNK